MKLSIITPCLNPGAAIRDAVECVASQATPDLEHIIQDCCSTDGTLDYLRSMEKKLPHLKVVSERDSGQSNAMNRAIARATGDLIGILNADDGYEADTLATILSLPQRPSKAPVFYHGDLRIVWHHKGTTTFQSFPKLNSLDVFHTRFPWNPASYFYSRSLHSPALCGPYEEKEHFGMDHMFMFRVSEHAELIHIDKLLGTYHIRPGTKTYSQLESGKTFVDQAELTSRELKRCSALKRLNIALYGKRLSLGYHLGNLLRGKAKS